MMNVPGHTHCLNKQRDSCAVCTMLERVDKLPELGWSPWLFSNAARYWRSVHSCVLMFKLL